MNYCVLIEASGHVPRMLRAHVCISRGVHSLRMRSTASGLQRGMAMELEVPEIKRNLSVNEYQRLRSRSLSPDPRHLSPQPPVRMISLMMATIFFKIDDCASLECIKYCSILRV